MKPILKLFLLIFTILLTGNNSRLYAQKSNPLEGRWDMVITQNGKELPSWLEIRHSGTSRYIGRFVYAFGSARPIAEVKVDHEKFSFAIPPQWEPGNSYLEFEGQLVGDILKGTMKYTDGKIYDWEASRSPILPYTKNPVWGEPKSLFNGKDLSGWKASGEKNQWVVADGILKSPASGSNLISEESFSDFKLHAEFRYPKGSNSGLYLRGRYEVQITDSKGLEPSDIQFGGVYGFLCPNEMVAKEAGEWQTFDITLMGNRVSITANGISIINDQIIPGITGGAIDSKEGEPGPLLIQGDHGPIEFRKIVITPLLHNQ
jgi:hypothetical protein